MSDSINIKNKKASYLYEFLDTYVAGIVLAGTEIKSIRQSKASINEAFCVFENGEMILRNMHIAIWENAGHYNHEPRHDRKLLLSKKEILKWESEVKKEGLTVIPRKVFLSKKGWAKVEIVLAKGKKLHDKREDLKSKDAKRDLDRIKAGKY